MPFLAKKSILRVLATYYHLPSLAKFSLLRFIGNRP
jgi:hypothetical protein